MPERPLTLMAVHAHPDDEAISTGGILARYSAEGVRTVLVTCTNGELGDAPGGIKPGEPGHDEAVVVPLRRKELEASCEVLGVTNLELLGYHDSGMEGWPQNDAPNSFWRTPVAVAGSRLAALMRLATGSATVAMITAAQIVAPIALHTAGVHPELLALATGAGSLIFSHVNDGGFWLVKEYFNMSVTQTIKTWSICETIISVVALVLTGALSLVLR